MRCRATASVDLIEKKGESREVKKRAAGGEEGDRGDKSADKGEQVQE